MQTVGVVGIGLVGSALVERFRRGGKHVVGYDVRSECLQALADAGGQPLTSACEVAGTADVIMLSLPDSQVAEAVLGQMAPRLPGKTVIDATTGDPDAMAMLGRRLGETGTSYLDATIAGSSRQVRAGEVVVLAGGDAAAFRAAEDLFRLFARQWFHLGPCGSGARMKLVVNLVLGLNRAVLAEGLAFARRFGFDLRLALDVLKSGPAYARVMDTKGPKMIAGDFTPEARLCQHLKDVRLILEAAGRFEDELPLSRVHEGLLARLEELGFGEQDNSAVFRAFDDRSTP